MLVMGYLENLLPSLGVPGIKLGLSNSVLIFALYMLDIPTAYVLMTVKVVLSGLLFSGVSAMLYAFAGGLASLMVMSLLCRFRRLGVPAVSAAGGIAHNAGQVSMAILAARLPMQVFLYLTLLAAAGAACGLLTGVCAAAVMRHLERNGFRVPKTEGGRTGWVLILLAVCVTAVLGFWAFRTASQPAGELSEPDSAGIHLLTSDDLLRQLP